MLIGNSTTDPGAIAEKLWVDTDGDGLPNNEPDEPALANVKIELLDSQGNVVASTITDSGGNYKYVNRYYLVLSLSHSLVVFDTGCCTRLF